MRLLVTSDIHYNHGRSTASADELIARINRAGGDVLLVVGDTASGDGDALERCLSRFTFGGARLFVAGNHELWTHGADSHQVYTEQLPRRVRHLGWHWLEGSPFLVDGVAVVGSIGWYDYSLAQRELGIPRRFYEHKVSPGAAAHLSEFAHLLSVRDDIAPQAMAIVARWNDGRFVKLHRPDEQFLSERLVQLESDLEKVRSAEQVVAGIHHLPFAQLLPPPHSAQWDFAKAYLGSARIGELLLRYSNVTHAFCGHSHFAAERKIGTLRAINPGCGYRVKKFIQIDIG
jgi:predicted phosphodiesterase